MLETVEYKVLLEHDEGCSFWHVQVRISAYSHILHLFRASVVHKLKNERSRSSVAPVQGRDGVRNQETHQQQQIQQRDDKLTCGI